jgi:hypothetical protein
MRQNLLRQICKTKDAFVCQYLLGLPRRQGKPDRLLPESPPGKGGYTVFALRSPVATDRRRHRTDSYSDDLSPAWGQLRNHGPASHPVC